MCDRKPDTTAKLMPQSVVRLMRFVGGDSTGKRAAKRVSRSSLVCRLSKQASMRAAVHHES